jgi:hypothetical protein
MNGCIALPLTPKYTNRQLKKANTMYLVININPFAFFDCHIRQSNFFKMPCTFIWMRCNRCRIKALQPTS